MERNTSIRTVVAACVLSLALSAAGFARTIYVDDDGPAHFRTIQAAVDDANDGDTVLVASGTYRGDGNRDIDFRGKAITVKSEAGPRTCIIDCQGSWKDHHSGFYFHTRESRDSVLDGFTITGGSQGGGADISCYRGSPTIRNCIITASIRPGGVGVGLSDSDASMSNCIIAGNLRGGLSCMRGHPVVQNCTIYGNRGSPGGGVQCMDARTTAVFVNCILAGNKSYGGMGNQLYAGGCSLIVGCADVKLINCCVEDEPNAIFVENWADPRQMPESCIRVDPLFVQPGPWDPNGTPDNPDNDFWVEGNYHLKSQAGRWDPISKSWVLDEVTSPCIDAGDPNSPIGEEPFPNGGRINMGTYGGTAEASKSWFGGPACETVIAGDINGDCRVDFEDLGLRARHWLEGIPHEADRTHVPPAGRPPKGSIGSRGSQRGIEP